MARHGPFPQPPAPRASAIPLVDPTTDPHTPARPSAWPAPAAAAAPPDRTTSSGRSTPRRQAVKVSRVGPASGDVPGSRSRPGEGPPPPAGQEGAAAAILGRGDYVREARRVRATWAAKPSRMHRHLGELSRRRDLTVDLGLEPRAGVSTAAPRPAPPRSYTVGVSPAGVVLGESAQRSRAGSEADPGIDGDPSQGATRQSTRRAAGDGGGAAFAGPAGDSLDALLARVFTGPLDFAGTARAFADSVGEALECGSVLRYSRRAALLRDAGRRGIGRFEANLIIAAVQHRGTGAAARGKAWENPRRLPAPRARGYALAMAGFVLVQSLIVAGFWHIFSS